MNARWQGYFPFLQTFRDYSRADFRGDAVASITVALLDVPQAMAYALIAGLPPVYGLYTSAITGFVGAFFSKSSLVINGPTNAISIMVVGAWMTSSHPMVIENPAAAVTMLTFMVGVVQVALALLRVGNLAQFVSRSVLIGFVSGAALLIVVNQAPVLLGLELPSSRQFVGQLLSTIHGLRAANLPSIGVGLLTILLVLVGKRRFPRWPVALLAVCLCALGVNLLGLDAHGVALIGPLPTGWPAPRWPAGDMALVADMANNALAIAILGCIGTLSISKGLSLSTGERVDNNQDFLSMGLAHLVGSFMMCMPGCGSFTRSALNHEAGARTRVSGMLCAVWIVLMLTILGPLARFIPKPSLAGLLVVLGISLIRWTDIRVSLRSTKSDASVLLLTFATTLVLHLDTAIYLGVVSSLVLFLRKASSPHLVEYNMDGDTFQEVQEGGARTIPEISIIHVEGELFFGAAELFGDEVRRLVNDRNIRVVILRLKNARHLDATAVAALEGLFRYLRDDQRLLLISGPSLDVMRVLRGSGLLARIGEDNVFPAEQNLTAATRKALLRAKAFLGDAKPEVRIFYEESRARKQGIKGAASPAP